MLIFYLCLFQSWSVDTRRSLWTPACPWRTLTWQWALLPPTHATRATNYSGELLPTFRNKRSRLCHKVCRLWAQKEAALHVTLICGQNSCSVLFVSLWCYMAQVGSWVQRLPIGPISKGQAVQVFVDSLTLGDGKDRLSRNVDNQL